jgi:hypothetical protein
MYAMSSAGDLRERPAALLVAVSRELLKEALYRITWKNSPPHP